MIPRAPTSVKGSKSQSTLEYMMTYGWMAIVVTLVISALFYLGVFGYSGVSSVSIGGFSGISVTSAAANSTVFEFSLVNDLGFPANISNMTLTVNGKSFSEFTCTNLFLSAGQQSECAIVGSFNKIYTTFAVFINYTLSFPPGYIKSQVSGVISLDPTDSPLPYKFVSHSVNVTITSPGGTTPSTFQQMIVFDPQTFAGYEEVNLGNIRFYNKAAELYSWCESGCTSESNESVFWVKLTNAIPSNEPINITMVFEPAANYDGVYAGEAPQLSPTYGGYDNGANVFNFYDNFAGTGLSKKWTGSGFIVSNGLFSVVNSGGVISTTATFSNPMVAESNMKFIATGSGAGGILAGMYLSSSGSGTYFTGWQSSVGHFSGGEWNPNQDWPAFPTSPSPDISYVWGISWQPLVYAATMYTNYANAISPTTDASGSPVNLNFADQINSQAAYSLNWVRVRAYPPSGVMPIAHVGSVETITLNVTNTQNVATPSPYQQLVSVDSKTYDSYENNDLSNVQFTYANGTIIPSWLESGNLPIFNGNDYVLLPHGYTNQLSSYTINIWVDPSSSSFGDIISTGDGTCGLGVISGNPLTVSAWNAGYPGNWQGTTTSIDLPIGSWSMLTLTLSGGGIGVGEMKIYINGNLEDSIEMQEINYTGSTTQLIGGAYTCSNLVGSFMGYLANYQFYNTTIPENQILQLYSEGMPGAPLPTLNHLVGHWSLAGNAKDSSGNGNNGVTNNVSFSGPGSASTDTTYWLKLGSIPADGSATIDMKLYPQFQNVLNNIFTGEAPELSPIYAQYDDGANVFTYYSNANGASTNAPTPPFVAEMGTLMYSNGSGIEQDINLYNASNWEYRASMRQPATCGKEYCFFTYDYNNAAFASGNIVNNTNVSYGTISVLSLYAVSFSPTGISSSLDYGSLSTLTGGYTFNPATLQFFGSQSGKTHTYWERTRVYPPNGVMPSVTLGAIV